MNCESEIRKSTRVECINPIGKGLSGTGKKDFIVSEALINGTKIIDMELGNLGSSPTSPMYYL